MLARVIAGIVACLGGISAARIPSVPSAPLHEIKLKTLYHHGSMAARGALVEVRLSDGPSSKPVRLLVDSGANDVLLWSKAAERGGWNLSRTASAQGIVRGFSGEAWPVWLATANLFFEGGLSVEQAKVRVVEDRPLQDADGLIGLNVFRDFVVELDVAGGKMRLYSALPQADGWIPWAAGGSQHLLVRTACNGRDIGMALLDTGASFSAIDLDMAGEVNGPVPNREYLPLRGVTGDLAAGSYRLPPVWFAAAGGAVTLLDQDPLAVNLNGVGRRYGVEVNAVIGYPALSRSIVQIDYRGRRLRILPGR